MKRRKKYLCHDPESTCRVGDLVMIRECQPLSKRKHFTVARILELSPAHRAKLELDATETDKTRDSVTAEAASKDS